MNSLKTSDDRKKSVICSVHNKYGIILSAAFRPPAATTSDVRILKFSFRFSPFIMTKDPRPQKYCNLQSAVSPRPQSSLCSATHCGSKERCYAHYRPCV